MTLSDQMIATDNRSSGFDYVRIILAAAVIASHVPLVCYGWQFHREFWTGLLRPIAFFIVPSFFALSGFLVAGSLERNPLPEFLTLRAVRIFPALAVEVTLSALIIGPLVTTFALSRYLADPDFSRYFLNLIGDIQYTLPGVFKAVPATDYVNLQLWTIPRELECYILISIAGFVGLFLRPRLMTVGLLGACGAIIFYQRVFGGFQEHDNQARGALPVLCFLFGVALYLLRNQVRFSFPLFIVAAIASWVTMSYAELTYLGPLAIAYTTVFLGLLNPRKTSIIKGADYSYGMYLYGFPVQQLSSFLLPAWRVWYVNLPISIAIAGLFACLSWNFIEKPIHRRRHIATDFVRLLLRKRRVLGGRI